MLTELYRSGKVKDDTLGVLAKSIICARVGCLATGPIVTIAGATIQLVESLSTPSTLQKPQRQPQQQKPQKQPPSQKIVEKEEKIGEKKSDKARVDWDFITSLVAKEARIDTSRAELILSTCFNYLSIYPSVGIFRLIEDISRMSKAESTVVKTVVEILRSLDVVEVKEEGVVNLKKIIKKRDLPL